MRAYFSTKLISAIFSFKSVFGKTTDKSLSKQQNYFDFGVALHAMKEGKRVSRKGLSSKGLFDVWRHAKYIEYVPENHDCKNDEEALPHKPYLLIHVENESPTQYVLSQDDYLADDWHIV